MEYQNFFKQKNYDKDIWNYINFMKKYFIQISNLNYLSIICIVYIFCGYSIADEYKNNLRYDIQFSNIQVGQIIVSFENKNKKISLVANSFSEGFVDVFYSYKSNLNAIFYNDENKWFPYKFTINSIYKDKKIFTEVIWDKKTKDLKLKLDPPLNLKKVHRISDKSLKNVIDPITALMRLIQNLSLKKSCRNKFRIFDGRRRYDVITKGFGNIFLENDRPKSFKGNAIVCGIKFFPLGGHRLKSKWKPENDKFKDIKIFFSNKEKNFNFPIRMVIKRWFGTIVVRLLKEN